MNNFIKIITIFAAAVLTACQKRDNPPADLSKVTVTFNQPLAGNIYHKGDTVNIDANIVYTGELSGAMVQVIDTAADAVLYSEDHDLHTDHFNLTGQWLDTCSGSAALKIVVTVAIANGTATTDKIIYFQTKP